MNDLELKVKKDLEDEGWEVLRNGWPDFLLVKRNEKGRVLEARSVEVKREDQPAKPHQKDMLLALSDLKIPSFIAEEGPGFGHNYPNNFHLLAIDRRFQEE